MNPLDQVSLSEMRGCRHPLATPLIDSERSYFGLDAQVEKLHAADIYFMPGLLDVSAGCVAICKGRRASLADARNQVEEIERSIIAIGSERMRLYQQNADPHLHQVLIESGYQTSTEVALSGSPREVRTENNVRLRPVIDDADWEEKLDIHLSDPKAPDGHLTAAERWLEMERRKSTSGELSFFLAEEAGRVCGTVGAMASGTVLRMKNLVVPTQLRKRGVGAAITRAMIDFADAQGYRALGLLALANGPALSMYLNIGMHRIAAQTEWVREP